MVAGLRLMIACAAAVIVALCVVMVGCTTSEIPPTPVSTVPAASVAVSPTDTLEPLATATEAPQKLTSALSPTVTLTPIPPTETPAPTFTPRPEPTAIAAPQQKSTPTPKPAYVPRPPITPDTPSSIEYLENGQWLERATQIRQLPWVADGVEKHEEIAVTALVKCGRFAPATFDALVAAPDTKERVNNKTGFALGRLCDLEAAYPDIWGDFMRKEWVQDGLTEVEGMIIASLCAMIFESAEHEASHRIWVDMINMPFLETVDSFDDTVVSVLARSGGGNGFGERFVETMSYPIFSDGISDEDARTIILLDIIENWRPDESGSLLSQLSDPDLIVEERAIELPLAGETTLTIVRYRQPETPTMDFLERAVRFNEDYMGLPFPARWIVLYFDDEDSGVGIAHHGSHIAMREELEIIGPGGWGVHLPYVLIHETGHTYSMSAPAWVVEGAANFLVYVSKREWVGPEAATKYASWTSPQCYQLANLAELEKLNTSPGDPFFSCNYEFGVQLFVELYLTFGAEAFQHGFRSLYLKSQAEDPSDNCAGTKLEICHLAAAFKSGLSDELVAKVDEILSRRYGPLP